MDLIGALFGIAVVALATHAEAGFSYAMGGFIALGALFYTVGNGLHSEAPFAWLLAAILLGIGFYKDRHRR